MRKENYRSVHVYRVLGNDIKIPELGAVSEVHDNPLGEDVLFKKNDRNKDKYWCWVGNHLSYKIIEKDGVLPMARTQEELLLSVADVLLIDNKTNMEYASATLA